MVQHNLKYAVALVQLRICQLFSDHKKFI